MSRYFTLGLSALLCVLLVGTAMGIEVNGKTVGAVGTGYQVITSVRYESASSIPSGLMAWSFDGSNFWHTVWSDSTWASGDIHLDIPGYVLLPVGEAFRDDTGKWFLRTSVNCASDSVGFAWTNR